MATSKINKGDNMYIVKKDVTWSNSKSATVSISGVSTDTPITGTLNSNSSIGIAAIIPGVNTAEVVLTETHGATHPVTFVIYGVKLEGGGNT